MKILKTGRNFLLHFLLPGLLITQLFTAVTAYAEPAADLGGALIAGDGSGDPLAKREQKEVPVIMYHLVTKNESYIGKYGITPKELENDLVFLKENGYTTILMQDLIDFVDGKGKLPEKPIVLTFDDGNSSDYIFLFPLLKKYDMKAVVSIVGKLTDEYSLEKSKVKPHLDWEQVKEMEKDGHVEIQNHSYNMHSGNGSARRDSESMEEYRARLSGDLEKTQAKVKDATGRMPTTFTYPFGAIGKGSLDILKEMGFKASLSCWEGVNIVASGNPECLYKMRRSIRKHGQPVSDVLSDAYMRLKKERANSVKTD